MSSAQPSAGIRLEVRSCWSEPFRPLHSGRDVARGWTQRRLAEALGVAEQQIQRYESSAYRSASLARLCDIADALGVTVTERAELRDPNAG